MSTTYMLHSDSAMLRLALTIASSRSGTMRARGGPCTVWIQCSRAVFGLSQTSTLLSRRSALNARLPVGYSLTMYSGVYWLRKLKSIM